MLLVVGAADRAVTVAEAEGQPGGPAPVGARAFVAPALSAVPSPVPPEAEAGEEAGEEAAGAEDDPAPDGEPLAVPAPALSSPFPRRR